MGFKNVGFYSRRCSGRTLIYDQACLEVHCDQAMTVWRQYTECDSCPQVAVTELSTEASVLLRTEWGTRLSIRDERDRPLCAPFDFKFGEYGRYSYNITNGRCGPISVTEQPDEPLFPFLVAIVALLSLATVWYLLKAVYKRFITWEAFNRFLRTNVDYDLSQFLLTPLDSPAMRRANTRLRSIDVFRGITISLMIFINYGGGGYALLRHKPWNGLTVADLVFPWFAWLMGFAMCLSLHTRLRTAMSRKRAFLQITKRSIIMIMLGLVLSSRNFVIEEMRIPGVLQRLGFTYFIVATVECMCIDASNNYQQGVAIFRDLRSTVWQWMFTLALVAVQVSLTLLLDVPNCPRGYLGPGGLHNNASTPNCTGGAAAYVDKLVFGVSHLHKGGSFRKLYQSNAPFDPEGLLGTLTCALVVQLGLQAARILLAYSHVRARILRWLVWGIITGLAAGGLCTFSQNDGPIPINKNLWSLSFCLATSSLAFFVLAFLYFIIDMYPLWEGRPFYYAGRNALLLYIGHDLMDGRFPFEWNLEYPSHMQKFAMNSLAVMLWLAVAMFLHKKNVILAL